MHIGSEKYLLTWTYVYDTRYGLSYDVGKYLSSGRTEDPTNALIRNLYIDHLNHLDHDLVNHL
ncbi:hypothetical protein CJ179_34645 [Rhodococcus sp. ACS1]|nr:hypothetical protein CJ179_34645 [Rhodococcus sp. ACS1]